MRSAASPRFLPVIATSGCCGLLAVAAYATHATRSLESLAVPPPVIAASTEAVRIDSVDVARMQAPPRASSKELAFVFRAGGQTWLALSDDQPRHGRRTLVEDDGGTATIAEVKPVNLPAGLRGWERETVIVDGTCTAKVTGFAVVTRLVGDPGYAGLTDEKWTVATAAAAGNSVLAARIDGCEDGSFARRASLAPITILERLIDDAIATKARAALLTTDAAHDAQLAWSENASGAQSDPDSGLVAPTSWDEAAQFTTSVLRHPKTGAVWVVIHAGVEHGCGGPDINVYGLFRLGKDGTIHTVHAKKLDTLYSIGDVIDLEGDGRLELIGSDWLGLDQILATDDGEEISRLEMPFHGCPC